MPTIMRFGALRVMIYTDHHGPAHVHVLGRGGFIVFYLQCEARTVSLRKRAGLGVRDEPKIADFLTSNLDILCAAWERMHDYR